MQSGSWWSKLGYSPIDMPVGTWKVFSVDHHVVPYHSLCYCQQQLKDGIVTRVIPALL